MLFVFWIYPDLYILLANNQISPLIVIFTNLYGMYLHFLLKQLAIFRPSAHKQIIQSLRFVIYSPIWDYYPFDLIFNVTPNDRKILNWSISQIKLRTWVPPPPVYSVVRVARSLVFCVVYCRLLFVLLSLFLWPYIVLSVFRCTDNLLVSSNSS